jgi:choline kinase
METLYSYETLVTLSQLVILLTTSDIIYEYNYLKRIHSSGLLRLVVRREPDVSEEHIVSIVRLEE